MRNGEQKACAIEHDRTRPGVYKHCKHVSESLIRNHKHAIIVPRASAPWIGQRNSLNSVESLEAMYWSIRG